MMRHDQIVDHGTWSDPLLSSGRSVAEKHGTIVLNLKRRSIASEQEARRDEALLDMRHRA